VAKKGGILARESPWFRRDAGNKAGEEKLRRIKDEGV